MGIVLVAFVAIVIGVWKYMTSSGFLVSRIEPVLSSLTGGRASIERAELVSTDQLRLKGVRIRTQHLAGDAGELLYCPSVLIDLDVAAFLDSRIVTKKIRFAEGTRVRISEDTDTGTFNFGDLRFDAGSSASSDIMVPQIEFPRVIIEVGDHNASQPFALTGSIQLEGTLHAETRAGSARNEAGASHWYAVELREIAEPERPPSMPVIEISGRLNTRTGQSSAMVSGISFDQSRAGLLPFEIRNWWKTIQPSGSLDPITIRTEADGEYLVELPMDGIDWSLPISPIEIGSADETDDEAPRRNEPLRMTDVRGNVVVHDGGADLVGITGLIDGVRYAVGGRFHAVSPSPGFDLEFEMSDFDLNRNLNIISILPSDIQRSVTENLLQLEGPGGTVDARVNLSRASFDPEHSDAPRPVEFSGSVQISNAEGMYQAFPYRLSGLTGELQFDNDTIQIVTLAGRGSGGAKIWLAGSISNLGPDPKIDLELFGADVPLNDELRNALGERTARQIDGFFDETSYARLREAGIVMSPDDLQEAEQQILALRQQQARLSGSDSVEPPDPDLANIRSELHRLTDLIDRVPVFKPGGRISLNSKIRRQPGADQPLKATTRIRLARPNEPVGVLYRKFPYPLWFVKGEIEVGWDRVEVTDDVIVVGPTGAQAIVTGYIDRVREPYYHLEENLRLTAHPVPVDSLLVHALPGKVSKDDSSDWPGRDVSVAGRVVGELNLAGDVTVDGVIVNDPETNKADYRFDIALADGKTRDFVPFERRPGEPDRPILNWSWPTDYPLHDVVGNLTVTNDELVIHRMRGVQGDQGVIETAGSVGWSKGRKTTIDLLFNGTTLDYSNALVKVIAGLAADSARASLDEFSEKYQPQINFDATLGWNVDESGRTSVKMTALPHAISMLLGNSRIAFRDPTGAIHFENNAVQMQSFEGLLSTPDRNDDFGRIRLDGTLSFGDESPSHIVGTVKSGRLDAPFYGDLLEQFGQPGMASHIADLMPTGRFDADFEWHPKRHSPGESSYRVNARPQQAAFNWRGHRYNVSESEGEVVLRPNEIRLHDLTGTMDNGDFGLEGSLAWSENALTTDLAISLKAPSLSDPVRQLLPAVARNVIDSLGLTVDGAFEIDNARLSLFDPDFDFEALLGEDEHAGITADANAQEPTMAPDPALEVDFHGLMKLTSASMTVPIDISQLNGKVDLTVRKTPDDEWLNTGVHVDLDSLRAEGRLIENGTIDLASTDVPGQLVITSAVGRCYDGRIAGRGHVQLPRNGKPGTFQFDVQLSDVNVDPFIRDSKSKLLANQSFEKIIPKREDLEGSRIPVEGAADVSPARPGLLFANVAIGGRLGDIGSRRGRGEIRVVDAELYDVPLLMWVLQVSSLALPLATSFDYADIAFYIEGEDVVFERLSFESSMMTMYGSGKIQFPSGKVDMRFRTASRMRAPLFSDLWETLRDALFSIHVTGTVDNPKTELVPLQ